MKKEIRRYIFSFINIKKILKNHYRTLKPAKLGNTIIYIVFPIAIGIISVFINSVNENLDSFLSIFIGLFINFLVLIVFLTITPAKEKKEIRKQVGEETFYNINYIIIISIFALALIMLKNIDFGFSEFISSNIKKGISFVFGFLFTQILLTILMIIKRIFNLFKFDIDNFNQNLK